MNGMLQPSVLFFRTSWCGSCFPCRPTLQRRFKHCALQYNSSGFHIPHHRDCHCKAYCYYQLLICSSAMNTMYNIFRNRNSSFNIPCDEESRLKVHWYFPMGHLKLGVGLLDDQQVNILSSMDSIYWLRDCCIIFQIRGLCQVGEKVGNKCIPSSKWSLLFERGVIEIIIICFN